MAYSAKFASGFYGPFRDRGRFDARSSATGPATRWIRPTCCEAMREVALDVEEGADIVMVKPALAYLDVIAGCARRVRRAGRRVQRVGRVRDAEGGRPSRAGSITTAS